MAAAHSAYTASNLQKGPDIAPKSTSANELSSDHNVIDVERLLIESRQVRTNDANPAEETHYVLVIHGTFSQPKKKGLATWFHPDPNKGSDNFCARLAVRLSGGHFGEESVWRALPDPELLPNGVRYPFYWDGSNTDEGRKEGAWQLAKLIRHIANRDPSARIHLIAHSHGGNVALKAIEQYVQKLEPRSAEEDWPDAVRERFRMAHQAQADEIARWRKVEGVPWFGRVVPFLVVRRGRKGEVNAQELYPWGYHRYVDALLHLGRRRKMLYLSNRRMTSPVSNALGKAVFLGTPFYRKQWTTWAIPRILLSFLISLVLGFVITVMAVAIWANIFGFDTSNNAVLFVAIGLSVLLFFAELVGFAERTLFRSGNMYHSDKVPWSPAQHALAIQAGKLDEAALALSAEPAARAFLLPLVRRATAHAGFVAFPRRPGAHAPARAWVFYNLAIFRAVVLNVVLLFPRIIFWAISKIVVRNTFNTIRSILMGLAYGLDTANLKNARVDVEETLVLGGSPRNIRTWDVRRLLALAEERGLARTWVEDFAREQPDGMGSRNGSGMGRSRSETNLAKEGEPFGNGMSSGRGAQGAAFRTTSGESSRSSGEASSGFGGIGGPVNGTAPVFARGLQNADARLAGSGESFTGTEPTSGRNLRNGASGAAALDGTESAFGRVPRNGSGKGPVFEEIMSSSASSYSFLWDDAELIARSDSSLMFGKLREQLSRIDHNPRLTKAQYARDLRCLCCVVEARFWEIRNQWQLTHATYYRNQDIVEAVVAFLNALEVPTT
ncbi:hypothetical protein KFL_000700290 [Klebsormidium nitens]|uniref:Uncharacterized protein n=1 Tax=Klebsormidium nitens TaxID=105231 RepID=A0A1Y1HTC1_KLENI|nr:hypothetical protein KFL_000700290 [Klebsormidium nitens]|eukprot:GAQ81092.1 hypothetical protein KFL_000700290 [Klebsormidium nitens]